MTQKSKARYDLVIVTKKAAKMKHLPSIELPKIFNSYIAKSRSFRIPKGKKKKNHGKMYCNIPSESLSAAKLW